MRSWSLVVLCSSLAAPAGADQGRFYLSTDRVFAPGQPVTVKIEANGIEGVEVRLYRIADPRAHFDAQADLHRPANDHAAPRLGAASLLSRGLRHGLFGLLREARASFGQDGRRAIKGTAPELFATAADAPPSPEVTLPKRKELPLIDSWRQPLSGEGWIYDTLDLQVSGPGAYLVEAVSGSEVATTVVLVSDVALITKQSSDQLLVWAIDPASGDPRSDVELTILEKGRELKTGKSGSDGLARFDVGLRDGLVVYGRHGDSFTLLDPRFFPANLPEPRVYVVTERPVYRPGQEVFFKGWAREVKDEAYILPTTTDRKVPVEIRDPKGEVWMQLEAQLSDRGSFDGRFELPEAPSLGTWQILATVAGKPYAGHFKVLAFVKPEVRLDVRLNQRAVRAGSALGGDIAASYYFGAPYGGAEVKITVTRTRFYVPWYVDADYSWYYSDAEYRNTAREVIAELSCTLDARGECPFDVVTKPGSEDHSYIVEATAIDPTGKTVSGTARATVTTGAFRLSFEPGPLVVAPGQKQRIAVRAQDYADHPVATAVEVVVRAERLAADGVVEKVEILKQRVETDPAGRAEVSVDPAKGGYYEVVATAKDADGVEVRAESFIFASSGQGDLPFTPSELEIVTDQRSYFAGQTALVLILAPAPEAKVLFTVEGGALYRAEVLATRRFSTLVKVEIGERQTPNFFLAATAVAGGQVFTRQRSVIVPPREKILKLEVAPDRPEAQPGEEVQFTVHVRDWAGKPVKGAEIALQVVDEAIYAISPEIAVPLESYFYPKKRNDVRTSESVSFRFFGSSQPLAGARAAWQDGDPALRFGAMKPQLDDTRKTFKDTAGWFPSLVSDAEGTARTSLKLPDNLTAWRATARALTSDAKVGMSTSSVRVKKPLMVRLALPPRLVEGDKGRGALVVQNLSERSATVQLELSSRSLAEGAVAPPAMAVRTLGEVSLPGSVEVRSGQTIRVPFEFTASGSGRIRLLASARGQGLEDSLETNLEVGEWARLRRSVGHGRVSPEVTKLKVSILPPEGANAAEAHLELDVVPSVQAAVSASLPYLAEYPYGCTEQTLSRFLPVLAASAALKGLAHPLGSLDKELPKMISAGMLRLGSLQHEDGGFGWWERDESDAWMTAWAVEGLSEAKALGVAVDADRLERGKKALESLLSRKRSPPPAARAFALYALARSGRPMAAMIEALDKEREAARLLAPPPPATGVTPSSRLVTRFGGDGVVAYLALAAHHSGQRTIAERARDELVARAEVDAVQHFHSWGQVEATTAEDDPVEATALALLALSEVGADSSVIEGASAWLLTRFEDQRFGTTRQTALAVRALSRRLAAPATKAQKVVARVNGAVVLSQTVTASVAAQPISKVLHGVGKGQGSVEVELESVNGGSFSFTAALVAPVKKATMEPTSSGKLTLRRALLALSGARGAYQIAGPVRALSPGDPVLVRLSIDAGQAVDHLVVEDPRAAGLSAIESDSGMQIEGVDLRPAGVRREHRDELTAFFVTRLEKGQTELYYLARAGLPGTYRVLPARAESMYLPNRISAQSASDVVGVASP